MELKRYLRIKFAQVQPSVDVSNISSWASFNLRRLPETATSKAISEGDDVKIVDSDVELDFREAESSAGALQVLKPV